MDALRVVDIEAVAITLTIGDKQALFLLIAADGTVNRMGSGAPSDDDHDLYIGRVQPPLLPEAVQALSDEMLQFMGGYDVAEKQGAPCRLSVGLHFRDGHDDGFGFTYGAESQGPPAELAAFVRHAVAVSEPWYQKQRQLAHKHPTNAARPPRPWWRFW